MIFFIKHKTAYEMRISDWSSDVCSSDLAEVLDAFIADDFSGRSEIIIGEGGVRGLGRRRHRDFRRGMQLGEDRGGADRQRVEQGKRVTVRVDLGGCRIHKKNNK